MPVEEEDGSPLYYGDVDHDEDGRQGIVAKCAQQGREWLSVVRTCIKKFLRIQIR